MTEFILSSFHDKNQNAERCCERVFTDIWAIRASQCSRKRGYGPELAYCKQHDPAAKRKRRDAQEERWKEENRLNAIKYKRAGSFPLFYAALKQIAEGHNDPRTLAAETIKGFE